MAKVANVQKAIFKTEGFGVVIRHYNKKDVHDNKEGLPLYRYSKAAPNSMTVTGWKTGRFRKRYTGFDIDVLDASNGKVDGRTLLRNVRATYR